MQYSGTIFDGTSVGGLGPQDLHTDGLVAELDSYIRARTEGAVRITDVTPSRLNDECVIHLYDTRLNKPRPVVVDTFHFRTKYRHQGKQFAVQFIVDKINRELKVLDNEYKQTWGGIEDAIAAQLGRC